MVSAKPPATPPTCKKWRFTMNGYTPIWKPDVSEACKNNYSKIYLSGHILCKSL